MPVSSSSPSGAQQFDRAQLIGRWNIRSWHELHDDGRIVMPFGDRPTGFLRYEPGGDMICIIARPGREPFRSPRQFAASEAEKAGAYDSFFVYAGSFEMVPGGVTHNVSLALFPNWENVTQVRRIAHLCANHLCLEADVRGEGLSPHRVRIEWDRVPC